MTSLFVSPYHNPPRSSRLTTQSRSPAKLSPLETSQPPAPQNKTIKAQASESSTPRPNLYHDPLKTGLQGRRGEQQRSRERGAFWNRSVAEVDNRRLPEGRTEPRVLRSSKSEGGSLREATQGLPATSGKQTHNFLPPPRSPAASSRHSAAYPRTARSTAPVHSPHPFHSRHSIAHSSIEVPHTFPRTYHK